MHYLPKSRRHATFFFLSPVCWVLNRPVFFPHVRIQGRITACRFHVQQIVQTFTNGVNHVGRERFITWLRLLTFWPQSQCVPTAMEHMSTKFVVDSSSRFLLERGHAVTQCHRRNWSQCPHICYCQRRKLLVDLLLSWISSLLFRV